MFGFSNCAENKFANCLGDFFDFSENLFQTMTNLVVSEGYAAVGYEYINVDDCWLEKNRGSNNELVADRRRFPSGMRALSDYVSISEDSSGTFGELVFF